VSPVGGGTMNNLTFTVPTNFSRQEAGMLQKYLDAMGPADGLDPGGTLALPRGHFYGDLVVRYPWTQIWGQGSGTILHGSILDPFGYCTFGNFRVQAEGKPYGIRLSATVNQLATSGVPRCTLSGMFIGGSAPLAHDGPFNGLELDGAIVTTCERSIFAFCSGSGVFVDTTQTGPPTLPDGSPNPAGTWSTNVNRFFQCTCNGNDRYGVEVIAGSPASVMQVSFLGGNIESNYMGAVEIQTMNFVSFVHVDFENNVPVTQLVHIQGNPVELLNCNFTGGQVTRAWLFENCAGLRVGGNRYTLGITPGNAYGVIQPSCSQVFVDPTELPEASTFIENRSYRG